MDLYSIALAAGGFALGFATRGVLTSLRNLADAYRCLRAGRGKR